MDYAQALAILKGGTPSREVDFMLNRAASSARFPMKLQPGEQVHDSVPRATADISSAFLALYRLVPYGDYTLTYARDRNTHTFELCGSFGHGSLASIAICEAIIRHMDKRGARARNEPPLPYEKPPSLSALEREIAETLRHCKWLTPKANDDAWCSAISAAGFAPRDHLQELDAIKAAVFAMRGEKP